MAGYRVAMGSGSGTLLLDNADVPARTTFIAAEFTLLTHTAGNDQSLAVVAQTGKRLPSGMLTISANS